MTQHRFQTPVAILLTCLLLLLGGCGQEENAVFPDPPAPATDAPADDADVLIIGAGLAGLSAAIDAANGGLRVLVIDMNSVFGGHGIQSGGVAIVGSPMQEAAGYIDSAEQAYADWTEWAVDGNAEWTRYYVENSREMIYNWVTGFGTRFDRIRLSHGNSIPRFHMTYRRGLNLVRPLYLEALRYSNVAFRWNHNAEHLIRENGRVVGAEGIDWRAGERFQLRAARVIMATGGFQSNIEMVKANWRSDLPLPDEVYSMSGQNSRGSGHRMAEEAGAALINLDRQYNGYSIVPNVLGLDEERGFTAGNSRSIWVNAEGRRFVTEGGIDRYVFDVVMRQQPGGHWAIYDEDDKDGFVLGGPHFVSADEVDREKIQRLALDNPAITSKAASLSELAAQMGIPGTTLEETVARFNQRVRSGESTDVNDLPPEGTPPEFTIDTPPFYATQLYPMANKSAGGVSIDISTHALDESGTPVPGLFAAGEVTGSAGINGLNGLDGMFTGPAILTGRVAGRTVAIELAATENWEAVAFERNDASVPTATPSDDGWIPSLDAEQLDALLATTRDGYWHFQQVHQLVREREYDCSNCHSAEVPFFEVTSRQGKIAQAAVCDTCHLAPLGTLSAEAARQQQQPMGAGVPD